MKALVTVSLLVELEDEDDASELAMSMAAEWGKQITESLERHGKDVEVLDGLLVNYGVAISFPQPILDEDPR